MEWHENALVLATKPHGETSLVAAVFTRENGLARGLVKGGKGRAGALWQPGNLLSCSWRARLVEQLGHFQAEPVRLYAAMALAQPERLPWLASLCALLSATLAEGEPHPALFDATLHCVGNPCPGEYARWEVLLLEGLGFGLDLAACAVTGAGEDLAYVSPKTGRAVSRSVGAEWQDRLFAYPAYLHEDRLPRQDEIRASLQMTGWFLHQRVFQPRQQGLPPVRQNLNP